MATVMINGWPEEINGTCEKCGPTHIVSKSSRWAKWRECGLCGVSVGLLEETQAAKEFTANTSAGVRIVTRRESDDPFEHGV